MNQLPELSNDTLIRDARTLFVVTPRIHWKMPDVLRILAMMEMLADALERTTTAQQRSTGGLDATGVRVTVETLTLRGDRTARAAVSHAVGEPPDIVTVDRSDTVRASKPASKKRPHKRVNKALQIAMDYLREHPEDVADRKHVTATTLSKRLRIGRSSAGRALSIMRGDTE